MALTKITTSIVAVNSLTAANIADNSIDATKIANNQILARHIAAGALSDAVAGISSAADATAITIDSSENVGIGATSPLTDLDVARGGTTGLSSVNARTTALFQNNNSAGTTISINAPNTGYSGIFLGDPENEAQGQIQQVHTTNAMQFTSSGGAAEMVLKAGNVGIGDTDPGAKLDVNSGTTNTMAHFHTTDDNGFIELKDDDTTAYIGVQDDYVYIGGAASLNSQNLVINDGSGKVGIGTTSPEGILHVHGGDSGSSYSADGADRLIIENNDSVAIDLRTPASNQALILFSDGTRGQGLIGYSHSADSLRFANNGNLTRMFIKSDGNVGIGTTSPDGILHLKGSADTYQYLEAGSSDGNAGILFQNNSGQTRGYVIYDTDDDHLLFQVNQAEKMRIDSSGRVGINRTPSKSNSKLEVGGADNVGLIHVEASGNFASWGIGSNQSKFYYNDTQMMGLTNEGVMKLMGGNTGGRQDLLFNNGGMSLADNAAYTLSGIANTGCLIAIGQQRSNVGVTYDHCLIFVETGTSAVAVANPSGRFSINTSGTDTVTNIYVSGGSVVLENKVGTTNYYTFACFVFQGN